MKLTLGHKLALVLAVILGILEYLNQQTFGFPPGLFQAVKYGILIIGLLGVTAATGAQLGLQIAELLHLSPAVLTGLATAATALAAFVSTFGTDGILKGVILGLAGFLNACFGGATLRPAGAVAVAPTAAAPVPPAV